MSTPIKITKLQRFVLDGSPYVLDRQVRNALPALLRLALAVQAEHDLMVRDEIPTPEELGAAAGEIDAALAAFDFTNEEPSA